MKNKSGSVFVYTILLVFLLMTFASIVLSENKFLYHTTEYFTNIHELNSKIINDGNILVNIDKNLNLNGDFFVDNISCPSGTSVTMSGTINKENIGTVLLNSGSIYCSGTYSDKELKLFFNTGFTDIIEADYDGNTIGITGGIGNTNFSDSDSTFIDFSGYNLNIPDLYDDDFNSDNYMVTSTGNTMSGTFYPSFFQDDDVDGRKNIYGFVSEDSEYKKVFWNSPKYLEIINNNSNNNDSLNIKIGEVTQGQLYFDIDKTSEIKLVEFDTSKYDGYNALEIININNGILGTNSGYLQNNTGSLSLSDIKTGNEFEFDFKNKNYAIFLKNTSSGALLYNITGETNFGTGIYLTPINDSLQDYIEYLGNEIIIDSDGSYISEEKKIIFTK